MELAGWWLVLETTGRSAQVGIVHNGETMHQESLAESRRHARDLARSAQTLLQSVNSSLREVSGVLISRGPGSYTGLRVGMISAQSLAYATGCPLVMIDTFAAVAAQTPESVATVEIISDAQQDHVYHQRFCRTESGAWLAVDELRITALGDWLVQLPADVPISGPGVRTFDAKIPAAIPRIGSDAQQPGILGMIAVARHAGPNGNRHAILTPIAEATPLYLRGSSAEEKLKQQTKSATAS
ncbi:tRNA (adenosine(37)-N6)-threonylcarbamoyltransferase complex dimerization subunit type 1 TsaB [Tuwongella immobilis]|uniref:Gcp-like domain-containing protein n=1 Tax=Tuwongella immobilis TaxID=692036 RepID=A0A6C2YM34_9BACT|nr:tRNA (adenosine(37)-N6)-threonylcarbamoyltransferase complex dimerization subunit type 1 TsaB [Tuwongella immobilis]VIP01982.1 molecular chaperone : Uncharacterized protein OS=Planctomyces maris DSM 8797 GN=PM8797T_31750 PE=4 SV=1: Peptidase_M22 [Tuwongella immobilis]VTS00033.1 molecular chaperone : Uncharacterized protein OS=Planctomyces maris DSM 8797 GN=PM8797T_31750 PE=4 SV=1: Peptidase_M22 [Tuwongella immobilis]